MTSKNIRDLMDAMEGDMLDNKKRQARLKAEVEAGYMPVVQNSSMTRGEYAMGDFVNLGWAEKEYVTDRHGDVEDIIWFYTGPAPFRLYRGPHKEPEVIQPNTEIK